MPYSPNIYYSSKTAPLCKILKQSENESWRITHLAHRKSYLVIRHLKTAPERDLITHDVRDFPGNPN